MFEPEISHRSLVSEAYWVFQQRASRIFWPRILGFWIQEELDQGPRQELRGSRVHDSLELGNSRVLPSSPNQAFSKTCTKLRENRAVCADKIRNVRVLPCPLLIPGKFPQQQITDSFKRKRKKKNQVSNTGSKWRCQQIWLIMVYIFSSSGVHLSCGGIAQYVWGLDPTPEKSKCSFYQEVNVTHGPFSST